MAVNWTQSQRDRVQDALEAFPLESAECEEAARLIVVVAKERDAESRRWRLRPPPWPHTKYIEPRIELPAFWFYHVTTEVEGHYVDVLTGTPGTSREDYLDQHWKYGDALRWQEES